MAYSFYKKTDDPFNFSYLNAAKDAYSSSNNTPTTTTTNNVSVSSRPATDAENASFPKKETYTPAPLKNEASAESSTPMNDVAAMRKKFYDQQILDAETTAATGKAEDEEYYGKKKTDYQSRLDQWKLDSAAITADQEAYTAEQKQLADDEAGRQLFKQAKGNREGQARLQKLFAGLGSVDSTSFQGAAARGEDRLATGQAETQRNLGFDKNDMDRELKLFKMQAKQAEQLEIIKFNDAIAEIDRVLEKGTATYNAAVQKVKDAAQESIFAIQEKIAEKEADFNFELKKAGIEDAAASQSAQGNKDKALNLVNSLMGGNYQAISGAWKTPDWMSRMGIAKGSGDAKANWEGLSNLLTLAKRGELKGSGTISDFETKMLEKAALAGLDPQTQTEDEFYRGLQRLQQDLQQGGATATQVRMVSPDGASYMVSQDEVAEAAQNGWRQI